VGCHLPGTGRITAAAGSGSPQLIRTVRRKGRPTPNVEPNTKFGTFTQVLYDEAVKEGWVVISIKNDWKRLFDFGE
jgi:hypothetical protein